MSYKWQERFCRYHKVDSAQHTWTQRKYPAVDWQQLYQRLRGHNKHLEAVINRNTPSTFRNKLQQQIKSGKTRSTHSAFGQGDPGKTRESAVGYYGPRGEKLMTEHIVNNFGDELRDLATKDPLLKASGVAGGVSGFIQAVLVPELAVRLIMEDMDVDAKRAQETLADSADLGELLNDEAVKRVVNEDSDFAELN